MPTFLKIIAACLQPPGLIIIFLFISLVYLLSSKKIKSAFWLMISIILLYASSIALYANKLINYLEDPYKQSTLDTIIKHLQPQTKAIVVLSAGKWPNFHGLMRNIYAAKLANITKLPILVSGGGEVIAGRDSEAAEMAKSLATDFNISGAIWVEGNSYNTMENAKFTKKMLEKNGITEVFLVTNAWHMLRAVQVFNKYGIKVIPVPVLSNIEDNSKITISHFIPSANNLLNSAIFFHEYIGIIWYKLLNMVHMD